MWIDLSLGIQGNIEKLYAERNRLDAKTYNAEVVFSENQSEVDQVILDQEERLILLEVGE